MRETKVLLDEEVLPKLVKLRQERSAYQEYQKICRDIDFLIRIHISAKYLKQCETLKTVEANEHKIEDRIANCKATHAKNLAEVESIENSVKEMQQQIDAEMGGSIKNLETQLSAKRALEATATGSLEGGPGNDSAR